MDNNAAQFVGSIPEHYDRGLGPVIFADYAADMARRVAALKPSRVLETAAGTGILTRQLRDTLAPDAQLTSTDLNADMLAIAALKMRPGERVELRPADAQALPFPDASFDAVVCQFGIMFFPDKPKGYREALRVLVPGGRYLFSVWDSHAYNGFARIVNALIVEAFPVQPPPFYQVPFSCAAIDPIKEALIAAGFDGIEIAVLPVHKTVADVTAFSRGLILGNPVADQMRARGVDPQTMVGTVEERLRREFGSNPTRMPLQTISYSARRPS